MKNVLLSYCILSCLLIGCNKSSSAQKQGQDPMEPTNQNDQHKSANPAQKSNIIRLVKHQVMDTEGTAMVASTYLLPTDWTVQDKLYWEYRDPTVPIRFQSMMQNADGSMRIQIYPDVRASWYTGPAGTNGYRPPSDIITGMKDLIKVERKGKNIHYVGQKILSDADNHNPSARQKYQSGVINIEYDDNGQTYEEEFYGRLDISDIVTPTVYGNSEAIIWGASGLTSFRALKGKLGESRKIAQTVSSSARLTKPFYNKLAQVLQLLSDQTYAQIFQAGQISRIISQTNDQMIANIDASYRQSQQSADRMNAQFSDYIRGVDRYTNAGSDVQLPSGYDNAWVNDRGEYILTNSTGYDPGRDYDGSWKQLQRQN
ncbi:MAG: hypothetical protein ABJB16_11265 [Saprospiraceae bacterium]